MSRTRIAIVGGVVALFIVAGGIYIASNRGGGGGTATINVTVTGAKSMSPDHLVVKQNDRVTITMQSDQTGEVHLHGYDIHFECEAGKTTSQTFTANNSGDFELEWEETSTHLGDLQVDP